MWDGGRNDGRDDDRGSRNDMHPDPDENSGFPGWFGIALLFILLLAAVLLYFLSFRLTVSGHVHLGRAVAVVSMAAFAGFLTCVVVPFLRSIKDFLRFRDEDFVDEDEGWDLDDDWDPDEYPGRREWMMHWLGLRPPGKRLSAEEVRRILPGDMPVVYLPVEVLPAGGLQEGETCHYSGIAFYTDNPSFLEQPRASISTMGQLIITNRRIRFDSFGSGEGAFEEKIRSLRSVTSRNCELCFRFRFRKRRLESAEPYYIQAIIERICQEETGEAEVR